MVPILVTALCRILSRFYPFLARPADPWNAALQPFKVSFKTAGDQALKTRTGT